MKIKGKKMGVLSRWWNSSIARQEEEYGQMPISNNHLSRPEQGQGSAVCGDSHRALVLPFKFNANQYAQNVNFEMCEHAQLLQSCSTLCNPVDCSPPGSSMHGILQARILEWVANPFSSESSWLRDRTRVSCIAGRFFTIWKWKWSCSVVSDSLRPPGL